MGALIYFIAFIIFISIMILFFEHTYIGRRLMKQFDRWFVKTYMVNRKATDNQVFEYETTGYRLYCKNDRESMVYSFSTEHEMAQFMNMYKRTYRGRIIRIEKIMRAVR